MSLSMKGKYFIMSPNNIILLQKLMESSPSTDIIGRSGSQRTEEETAIINAVTSGLADYRGYDTMGEETVILTGAIGVILLLRRRGRL